MVTTISSLDAPNPVVLIDGRSGSGKSTLAQLLASHWPGRARPEVIGLDSLYPGWDGLTSGADYACEQILRPHDRGATGMWRRWDWDADVRAETHVVDPDLPIILEGAGVITADSAALSDVRVWLESPAMSRQNRALDRDGDTYRPHWDRWAAQEERHITTNSPADRATHLFVVP